MGRRQGALVADRRLRSEGQQQAGPLPDVQMMPLCVHYSQAAASQALHHACAVLTFQKVYAAADLFLQALRRRRAILLCHGSLRCARRLRDAEWEELSNV